MPTFPSPELNIIKLFEEEKESKIGPKRARENYLEKLSHKKLSTQTNIWMRAVKNLLGAFSNFGGI